MSIKLTSNEIAILRASRTNEYCDAYHGDSPWVFAVIQESKLAPKIARGVIASLVKKELVIIDDYEGNGKADDMTFSLTSEGVKAIVQYNLLNPEGKN